MPALLSTRAAGCLVAGAMAAMAASPALAIAAGTSGTETGYAGHAFGATVILGAVSTQNATANVQLCTKKSGVTVTNATPNALTLPNATGTLGQATTAVTSHTLATGKVQAVSTTSVGPTKLAGGLVQFGGLAVSATVTRTGTTYKNAASVTFTGLTVAGLPVASPAPNSSIELPTVGTLELNTRSATVQGGAHSEVVTALTLTIDTTNPLDLPSGTITLGYADALLHDAVHHMASGSSYGTSVGIDSTYQSLPTARATIPCGGSGGVTGTPHKSSVNVAGVLATGATRSTETSDDSSTATTAVTGSTTNAVSLFNGAVTATTVAASAHTKRTGSKVTTASTGTSVVGLTIAGVIVPTGKIVGARTFRVPGLGTLYVNEAVPSATGIQVYGLQLVLSGQHQGLKKGTTIIVGSAHSAVAT